MQIIAFCAIDDATIQDSLGDPEYSYYFVYRQFVKALADTYDVVALQGSLESLETVCRDCLNRGEACICLFFSQPHKVPSHIPCPVIPVFAWEFDSLPEDANGGMQNDWGWRLAKQGWAITHSNHAVQCVRQKIRTDFPVISIPAPVWDDYRHFVSGESRLPGQSFTLHFQGIEIDSAAMDLAGFNAESRKTTFDRWIGSVSKDDTTAVDIDGIVYLSVFNPDDKRKNWPDMLRAFCWEFKQTPDATLILKLSNKHTERFLLTFLSELFKLSPFACRVLILDGYLDEDAFQTLVANSDYVVNTSHGEGQCLPLMEGMSAGKPAVSPDHTGMADYIRPDNAFIVDSSVEPAYWPHDPRERLRALQYRIDWQSLCTAYRRSYRLIKEHPDEYRKMSLRAYGTMQQHCSCKAVLRRLKPFLEARQREHYDFGHRWRAPVVKWRMADRIDRLRPGRVLTSLRRRVGALRSAFQSRISPSDE